MAESTTTPAEAGETGPVASSTDTKFFVAVVKNIKGKADVDWVGVAAELQLKNPEVAKVRFGQIKRKLGITSDGTSASTKKSPVKTPAKVKKAPAARAGSKGKKGGKVKKEEVVEDDGYDDQDVKEELHQDQPLLSSPGRDDFNVEAQLQADLNAMVNPDGFF